MNAEQLVGLFRAMADTIEEHKDHLCELDGAIGDADHGVTMSIGFKAVRATHEALDTNTAVPTDVFNSAAKSFLNAVGASAGPLYATAFMRAGAALKGHNTLDTSLLGSAIEAMAESMQFRGKAEAGDKTMLDAWLPAAATAASLKDSANNPAELMLAVAQAANEGALATINMQAKKGRSAKLGERSVGHQDAGAASTALLLAAIADHLNS